MDGVANKPDCMVSFHERFGIDSDLMVPAFSARDDHVLDVDDAYRFNPDVTLAILAGFARNRRVLVRGMHGTGQVHAYRTGRGAAELAVRARSAGLPA